MADTINKNICSWCGKTVEGEPRNVAGEMHNFCWPGDCSLKLEKKIIKENKKRRDILREQPSWYKTELGEDHKWYKKKWRISYRNKRWELCFPDSNSWMGSWRACGHCSSKTQGWKIAVAVADLLEPKKKSRHRK